MALTGFAAVLYYGIFASLTGGYLPYRVKNWWLIVFHLYLFLSFVLLPLTIFLVGVHTHTGLSTPLPPSPSPLHHSWRVRGSTHFVVTDKLCVMLTYYGHLYLDL